MRNAGLDSEEIKQKLSGNIIPFPEEKQMNTSDKSDAVSKSVGKDHGQAILEQKDHIADQISSKVSDRVVKEMDYQFRLREAEEGKKISEIG